MKHACRTKGVCAMGIGFELNGDVVTNIEFLGGCDGNLKAISKLLDGQTVDYIVSKLEGNKCGYKDTSCADQLAKAVKAAYAEEQNA